MIALAAVDWGTSHLRIWALDSNGGIVAARKSNEGMSSTARDRFEPILEKYLNEMGVGAHVPVMMCGMAGSRQGWAEAGYVEIPTRLEKLGDHAVRVPHPKRDIRILPGLSKTRPGEPDVMRSEETQLLGLLEKCDWDRAETVFACMPGTHSKWVQMASGVVEDYVSFITGDMFAALSGHSVLSHSVSGSSVDAHSQDFLDAVQASLNSPTDILARLFSIRPDGLLNGLNPDGARARLSGYLIGQEIAGVKARLSVGGSVELVGGGMLGELYQAALGVATIRAQVHDGEELVIAGMRRAAASIWNLEIAEGIK